MELVLDNGIGICSQTRNLIDALFFITNKLTKGRTIRYLRGGLGNNQKKIRAQKQSRKKISCTTNLLKKKIEQGLGVIFKIVVQLF